MDELLAWLDLERRNAHMHVAFGPPFPAVNCGQLVAFDESGQRRTLYPTEPDRFFEGPGFAVERRLPGQQIAVLLLLHLVEDADVLVGDLLHLIERPAFVVLGDLVILEQFL